MDERSLFAELDEILNKKQAKISLTAKKKLVLSGGGSKGMAHIGALHALDEAGLLDGIDTYAGTSIGGFILFCIYIGYKPMELFLTLKAIDFKKLVDTSMSNVFSKYGFDTGKKIVLLTKKLMEGKGVDPKSSFEKLQKMTGKTFIVTGSCINDHKCHYFSHMTYPNMAAITAIRITISVPFYFTPVTYQEKMFVDGGCIDNYPIHLFKKDIDSVIGIYLSDSKRCTEKITNMEDYITNVFNCCFEGFAVNTLKEYSDRTIKIELESCGAVDFSITAEKKQLIFDIGYKMLKEYIN
jgi:NTE family protein